MPQILRIYADSDLPKSTPLRGNRAMSKPANIKIGDSVVVKDGVKCPDMESLSLAGWQGRVSDIFDGGMANYWLISNGIVLPYDLCRRIISDKVKSKVWIGLV